MFFQINITPKEKKGPSFNLGKTADSNKYNLLLAPFQPPTRIKLDAHVQNTVQCQLTLTNSNNRTLTVSLTKIPPQERCVSFSDTKWTIQPESNVVLDISWQPQEAGNWRDVMQLSDNRHVKYDVPLMLTCTDPQKKAIKRDGRPKKALPLSSKINNSQNIKKNVDFSKPLLSKNKIQTELTKIKSVNSKITNKENISFNVDSNWMLEQARNRKQKEETKAPLDFSQLLDSSAFKFTPVKSQFTSFNIAQDSNTFIPVTDSKEVNKTWLVKQETTTTLRKETYVTVPRFLNLQDLKKNNEEDDQYDDSLSPKTPDVKRPQSNISKLFDDIKFTPFKHPNNENIDKIKFSPNHCSTATKPSKNNVPNITPDSQINQNRTFDVENNEKNVTYELPTSPKAATNTFKPTCLAKSFSKDLDVDFSTSISVKYPLNTTCEHSRYSNQFSRSQIDLGSAKDCLEADLWVKSKNISLSPLTKNIMHSTLDSITEEDIKHLSDDVHENINLTKDCKESSKKERAICIEISPPKYIKRKSPIRRVSPVKRNKIMKEKNIFDAVKIKKKEIQQSIKNHKTIEIPGVQISKLSFKNLHQGKNKNISKIVKKQPKEVSVKLHDPNDFLAMFCNPDPFAPTMTCDPFLANTFYYDDHWVFMQEIEFKKWLNVLLSPPEQLTTDIDSAIIDIGKVWQSCRTKEDVALAETKESLSARYHTNARLNALRKAACAMYRSSDMITVLSKLTVGLEKEILTVRTDKDLHRDIGLQKIILELFISYNPLWLRIGLETIYGETIPLQSNNDVIGLSRFLIHRFFSDPFIVKQHSSQVHPNIRLKTFQAVMNKFILKKFLFLVYFLDYAKRNKLIAHDPCLFHKKAAERLKDSREILLTFSRECLSGIGDITKVLRQYNYVVSYKQTYLDEYNYAVENLSTDLRDGVRLCRVMELMTGKNNLTKQCRVPTISRLQKVHNVKIALTEIKEAGYTIKGDIDANCIADGHREKTLSLLWQLIYKFQAPRYEKAAKIIQSWWQSKLWYVNLKKMVRTRKHNAASVIQRAWRCYLARRKLCILKEEYVREFQRKTEAVRKIQLCWRAKKESEKQQKEYQRIKQSIIKIQKWWRQKHETEPYIQEFRKQRQLVIKLQQHWRAKQIMKRQRNDFFKLKASTIKMQRRWRARRIGKQDLKNYQNKRNAIIFMQRKWRATLLMEKERQIFFHKLQAIRNIQQWWRRCLTANRDRNNFIAMKNAVRTIEKVWIAKHTETEERKRFLAQKNSVKVIQRAWKNHQATKKDILAYRNKKQSCLKIQSWWRCVVAMRRYEKRRLSCVKLQRWYRCCILARKERSQYLALKDSAIIVQKNWRMILAKRDYKNKKNSVLKIESWYKRCMSTRMVRNRYLQIKMAVKEITIWWLRLRNARQTRIQYLAMKKSIVVIQQRWRAQIAMKKNRQNYLRMKQSAVKIQSWWRMVTTCNRYHRLRAAVKTIEIRRLQLKTARETRAQYLKMRKAIIVVQQRWRAQIAMKGNRQHYLLTKQFTVKIQSWWRMILEKQRYKELVKRNNASIVLQRIWRAKKCGRQIRETFAKHKSLIMFVQRKWRAILLARSKRNEYLLIRQSAITIQKNWKRFSAVRNLRKMKMTVLMIENQRKHILYGRQVRADFLKLKMTVISLQRFVRMKQQIRKFRRKQNAAIRIQQFWQSIIKMRECKIEYERQKVAAIVLQRRFRARNLAIRIRKDYKHKILAIITIQRWWKNILRQRKLRLMKEKQKFAVDVIEKWWLYKLQQRRIQKIEKEKLMRKHNACVKIQAAWRGYRIRLAANKKLSILRERARDAAKAAVPSATLASRLKENIEIFRYASNIGQLSVCLSSLDVITRLSPNACINVCRLNLVSKLYDILNRANRSLPWLDICLKVISILLTLAKFSPTKPYVLKEEHIEDLVRLLTISVDKKQDLFLHTATLLWILTEDEEYVEAVQQCSRTKYLLSSLYTSTNKKLKSLPGLSNCKADNTLPNPKPDWGLNHKRPRTFSSLTRAITSIATRLNILNITPQVNDSHRSFNFSL